MTDGTMGAAQRLTGPTYRIDAALGRRSGTNLFHSFAHFGLRTGERAVFAGGADIRHVIARVTGGAPSRIDGEISTAMGLHADLWLINPAGMTFGPKAALDVAGSFHAGVASAVLFADGSRFEATVSSMGVLSIAPPAAFGFLGRPPGDLVVREGRLRVDRGQTISLAGPNLGAQSALLRAPGGQIRLAAANGGTVTLNDSSVVTTGAGGGIVIAGGRVELVDSIVQADLVGGAPAGIDGVRLIADEILVKGGRIEANTIGIAGGRRIVFVADDLQLTTDAEVNANTRGNGAGGVIRIVVNLLEVLDGATISTTASKGGPAGTIDIMARDSLILAGRGQKNSQIKAGTADGSSGTGGEITVRTDRLLITGGAGLVSETRGSGRAGDIVLEAGRVDLHDGGVLTSASFADGAAGDISLTANVVTIRGTAEEVKLSGLVASSAGNERNTTLFGAAGTIQLDVDRLFIGAGGRIGSFTRTPLSGGVITIVAETVVLADGGFIASSTTAAGPAGTITIAAGRLVLRDGGRIESSSASAGDGGTVTLDAGSSISIRRGAAVAATGSGGGRAGSLRLVSNGDIVVDGASVATTASQSDGGDIVIRAGRVVRLTNGGAITTSVAGGRGSGGNITLTGPRFLVLDPGAIQANAFLGTGGNLSLQAANLLVAPESRIEASSALGIDGNVDVDAPESDAAAGLTALNSALSDAGDRLARPCDTRRGSARASFTRVGRGRMPLAPGDVVFAPGIPAVATVGHRSGEAQVLAFVGDRPGCPAP